MPFPSPTRQTFNFPTPIQRDQQDSNFSYSFPHDLTNGDKRNFYTQIQFVDYFVTYQSNLFGSYANPSGGIRLPIPLKINENFVLSWSEMSYQDASINLATQALGGPNSTLGGIFSKGISLLSQLGPVAGVAMNPLLFLQFQRPEFKEYSFSWVLTPRNRQESETIRDVVKEFKRAAAPTNYVVAMGYPKIALIRMHPNDLFDSIRFKPCVITSVQVNYTAAPNPSFFEGGAPTVVTLVVNLKEMQFWFRDEI